MMRSLGLRTNDVAPRVLKVVFYLGEMALRRWLGHEEEVADEKAEMRAIVDDVSCIFVLTRKESLIEHCKIGHGRLVN